MLLQSSGPPLPKHLQLIGVDEVQQMFRDAIRPVSQQRVNIWADEYRMLSSASTSRPGNWVTDTNPPTKEIMECLSHDHPCNDVVVVSPTQWGKTEIILNLMFQKMDQAPCPILIVQPTINDAKKFVKQRIDTALKLMHRINKKIGSADGKKGGDAMFYKEIPGGAVMIGWSNSVSNLSSTPIFILICDEVDKYAFDADGQGCPIALADARTENFPNAKRLYTSTPANEIDSRIWPRFLAGDQRLFMVPCWHCNHMFWMDLDRVEWETTEAGILIPDSVRMKCPACEYQNEERHKGKMLDEGQWVAQNKDGEYPSFRINDLYKPTPWGSWIKFVKSYRKAKKSVHTYKVWVNTKRALPWKDREINVDEDLLYKRREEYASEVPDRAMILTSGVDVQDDRLEAEIVGWGSGYENWGITRVCLWGNTLLPQVWKDLDAWLKQSCLRSDGSKMFVAATGVDSLGHRTDEVYRWCKPREFRRIFPCYGTGGEGKPILGRVTTRHKSGCYLFPIGSDTCKDEIMSGLLIEDPGPNYCHFPKSGEYDKEFFKQITAESNVLEIKDNVERRVWRKTRARNEALDIRQLNRAALEITSVDLDSLTEPYLAQPVDLTPRKTRKTSKNRGIQP